MKPKKTYQISLQHN